MLHTRLNRAFRSVFRFVSDNNSDIFCIVCTQTAFFIEKQKALGDFQIIFEIIFASFVPDLIGYNGKGRRSPCRPIWGHCADMLRERDGVAPKEIVPVSLFDILTFLFLILSDLWMYAVPVPCRCPCFPPFFYLNG